MQTSFTIRRNVVAGILLLALAPQSLGWVTPSQTEGGAGQEGKEKKKEYFTDEDLKVEKVSGNWFLVSSVDLTQAQDYSVPVVVAGIQTVNGQGKYLGRVKMPEAKIENRSQKLTQAIQLRWSLVLHEEPNTVLLEGVTPVVELRMEPFSEPRIIDIPPIYFNKIVKPLLRDGEFSGRVRLIVGMQEVRYADGTTWRRTQQAAFQKAMFSSSPVGPMYFKPALFLDLTSWRRLEPQLPITSPCEEKPRLLASAFLFRPLQILDPH